MEEETSQLSNFVCVNTTLIYITNHFQYQLQTHKVQVHRLSGLLFFFICDNFL